MEDSDVLKMVNDKISECRDLYERIDGTKSLLQDKYVFTDARDKNIPGAISVTTNLPSWHAGTMSDKLVKLKWQTVVESGSPLPKSRIATIERFSDDVWAQADEFVLDKYGLSGGLNAWNAKKVLTRGLIGARWWLYYDKEGNLVVDCIPLDMRWCPHELNEWYCNRTFSSAAHLQSMFSKKKGARIADIPSTGSNIEMRDFWDGVNERVFINDKKVWEQPNIYKEPPFVVILNSSGFQFRDSGYLEHEAETFDWKNRNIYEEINRSASIAQSLALEGYRPGTIQPTTREGTGDKSAKPDRVPETGEEIRVFAGEEPKPFPKTDITNAFIKSSQILEQAASRGGMTDTEAGNNTSDRSALWVTTQNALLDEKLMPYRDALSDFKMRSMRMIIDQYIQSGKMKKRSGDIEFGVRGMKHSYSAAKLGDPSTYRISYRPMMDSKEQVIANTVTAAGQKGLLSDEFILAETMQIQDVQGELRKVKMQNARRADPTIEMFEQALAYAEEAAELSDDDADAKNAMSIALIDSVVSILKQREAVQQAQTQVVPNEQKLLPAGQSPAETEGKPNLQGLMGLTASSGGGGNGGAPRTIEQVRAR